MGMHLHHLEGTKQAQAQINGDYERWNAVFLGAQPCQVRAAGAKEATRRRLKTWEEKSQTKFSANISDGPLASC
jgi:hypothetical protein